VDEDESTRQQFRQLACMLEQHEWIVDPDDIRFRECIYCGATQYLGKEAKRGRRDDDARGNSGQARR
jgi:hypothetical protein